MRKLDKFFDDLTYKNIINLNHNSYYILFIVTSQAQLCVSEVTRVNCLGKLRNAAKISTFMKIVVWGEEGQPQQFLVRATFSSFSRPSHLEILVLTTLCFLSVKSSKIELFVKNQATLKHILNIEFL